MLTEVFKISIPEAVEGGSQVSGGELDSDKYADNVEDIILDEYPADCCPDCCYVKFPFCRGDDSEFWVRWDTARKKSFFVVEHKYFETVIITMILISSLALVSFTFLLLQCKIFRIIKVVLSYAFV